MSTSSKLPMLDLPSSLNYIGAFLTMDCNLNCSYCINDPVQGGDRKALFHGTKTLTPDQWVRIFNRIPQSDDLPITLQGGEPTLYFKSHGIGLILQEVNHYFDLLTNFAIDPHVFIKSLHGMHYKFMRSCAGGAQSIRVSYHPAEMNRVWRDRGFEQLIARCEVMRTYGFQVSSNKNNSNIAIIMVDHPENEMPEIAEYANVVIEKKPFLGVHNGLLFGEYLYPMATDLVSRGFWPEPLRCECRTTELLIDPLGDVWQCHYHLYNKWTGGDSKPVGNMLDPSFNMGILQEFRTCGSYGKCIGCDVKVKNNRFQDLLHVGKPHTSVEIKNIQWPEKTFSGRKRLQ